MEDESLARIQRVSARQLGRLKVEEEVLRRTLALFPDEEECEVGDVDEEVGHAGPVPIKEDGGEQPHAIQHVVDGQEHLEKSGEKRGRLSQREGDTVLVEKARQPKKHSSKVSRGNSRRRQR